MDLFPLLTFNRYLPIGSSWTLPFRFHFYEEDFLQNLGLKGVPPKRKGGWFAFINKYDYSAPKTSNALFHMKSMLLQIWLVSQSSELGRNNIF